MHVYSNGLDKSSGFSYRNYAFKRPLLCSNSSRMMLFVGSVAGRGTWVAMGRRAWVAVGRGTRETMRRRARESMRRRTLGRGAAELVSHGASLGAAHGRRRVHAGSISSGGGSSSGFFDNFLYNLFNDFLNNLSVSNLVNVLFRSEALASLLLASNTDENAADAAAAAKNDESTSISLCIGHFFAFLILRKAGLVLTVSIVSITVIGFVSISIVYSGAST